eukprot:2599111-Amphidinium_carterae.1
MYCDRSCGTCEVCVTLEFVHCPTTVHRRISNQSRSPAYFQPESFTGIFPTRVLGHIPSSFRVTRCMLN